MQPNEFESHFLVNKNLLIKIYIFVNNKKYNFFIRYLVKILLNRIAFGLLKSGKEINTSGSYKGKPFRLRSLNSQFHSIYFTEYKDNYEPEVNAIINQHLQENDTFVDIGSNWGHHSINAAINKKATVYSYEPNPYVFNDLKKIKEDLDIENLNIFNIGLGQFSSQINLTQNHFESGRVSINANDPFLRFPEKILNILTLHMPIKWKANISRLDDIYKGPKISLMKIDIEEFEIECLKGCKQILKTQKPKIILEVDSNNYKDLDEFLSQYGYKIYQVKSIDKHFHLLEINKPIDERCNVLAICDEI